MFREIRDLGEEGVLKRKKRKSERVQRRVNERKREETEHGDVKVVFFGAIL